MQVSNPASPNLVEDNMKSYVIVCCILFSFMSIIDILYLTTSKDIRYNMVKATDLIIYLALSIWALTLLK